MNWKRGLFRFWIVGSTIWILVTAALIVDEAISETGRMRTEAEIASCKAVLKPDENPFSCFSPIVTRNFDTSKLVDGLPLVFAPPVVVLALGMALGWAVAGFTRSRSG